MYCVFVFCFRSLLQRELKEISALNKANKLTKCYGGWEVMRVKMMILIYKLM